MTTSSHHHQQRHRLRFSGQNPIFQHPLRQRVTSQAPPLCSLHSHAPARDSSFRPPFGLSGVGSYFSGLIPEFPALSSALCGWLYALLSSQLSLVTCFCWVCCCFFSLVEFSLADLCFFSCHHHVFNFIHLPGSLKQ